MIPQTVFVRQQYSYWSPPIFVVPEFTETRIDRIAATWLPYFRASLQIDIAFQPLSSRRTEFLQLAPVDGKERVRKVRIEPAVEYVPAGTRSDLNHVPEKRYMRRVDNTNIPVDPPYLTEGRASLPGHPPAVVGILLARLAILVDLNASRHDHTLLLQRLQRRAQCRREGLTVGIVVALALRTELLLERAERIPELERRLYALLVVREVSPERLRDPLESGPELQEQELRQVVRTDGNGLLRKLAYFRDKILDLAAVPPEMPGQAFLFRVGDIVGKSPPLYLIMDADEAQGPFPDDDLDARLALKFLEEASLVF